MYLFAPTSCAEAFPIKASDLSSSDNTAAENASGPVNFQKETTSLAAGTSLAPRALLRSRSQADVAATLADAELAAAQDLDKLALLHVPL